MEVFNNRYQQSVEEQLLAIKSFTKEVTSSKEAAKQYIDRLMESSPSVSKFQSEDQLSGNDKSSADQRSRFSQL